MTTEDGRGTEARHCECGEPLVEDADGRSVTIDARTFPFSRATDYVLCRRCGDQIPVERLHPDPEPATTELHNLAVDPDELKDQSPLT